MKQGAACEPAVALFFIKLYRQVSCNIECQMDKHINLFTRYFSFLDKTYSDFIMCPKIDKIERENGDTRRHVVHASALNYGSHHGEVPYDRIHITLTDTPENGVKINKVIIQKGISGKEISAQCRREN
ncbi:hypothetical protein AB4Z29_10950 [Paenibacillus sp. 2TAB23]|uniref:hypothetical protein n=1 Tax=Paenibacillus sp. 2TAB23 TaxID=3233004 RepID=UPI003F990DC5